MTDSNNGWNDDIGKTGISGFNTIFADAIIEKRIHRKKAKTESLQQTKKKPWLFITKNL